MTAPPVAHSNQDRRCGGVDCPGVAGEPYVGCSEDDAGESENQDFIGPSSREVKDSHGCGSDEEDGACDEEVMPDSCDDWLWPWGWLGPRAGDERAACAAYEQ